MWRECEDGRTPHAAHDTDELCSKRAGCARGDTNESTIEPRQINQIKILLCMSSMKSVERHHSSICNLRRLAIRSCGGFSVLSCFFESCDSPPAHLHTRECARNRLPSILDHEPGGRRCGAACADRVESPFCCCSSVACALISISRRFGRQGKICAERAKGQRHSSSLERRRRQRIGAQRQGASEEKRAECVGRAGSSGGGERGDGETSGE